MEKETKKCPYCGEEILAVAKKCKHCGEWLEPAAAEREEVLQNVEVQETAFETKYLYNWFLVKVLFWIGAFGAFVQFLHDIGLSGMEGQFSNARVRLLLFLAKVPESLGILLYEGVTIVFVLFLMALFSHLHRPLRGLFIASISLLAVLTFILLLFQSESSSGDYAFGILSLIVLIGAVVVDLILGSQIVRNYAGAIRNLGWVIVGYTVVSLVVSMAGEAGLHSHITAWITFICDIAYLWYLRNTLSDDDD